MKPKVLSALLASVAISQIAAADSVGTPRPDLVAKAIAGEAHVPFFSLSDAAGRDWDLLALVRPAVPLRIPRASTSCWMARIGRSA